jgi:WD domain, G-beta repeat
VCLLQVIRQYHGHLSGIYSLALHPTLDVLISGGRDSVARVWDMRTKVQVGLSFGLPSTADQRMKHIRRLYCIKHVYRLHEAHVNMEHQQHALKQAALQAADPRLQTGQRSAVWVNSCSAACFCILSDTGTLGHCGASMCAHVFSLHRKC